MGYHRKKSLSSDEGKSNYSKPDQTNRMILVNIDNIILLNPEDKFVCHEQVITTRRDKGRH